MVQLKGDIASSRAVLNIGVLERDGVSTDIQMIQPHGEITWDQHGHD